MSRMNLLNAPGQQVEGFCLVKSAAVRTDSKGGTYDVFTGPTIIAFSKEHPGAAARIFKEFAKKEQNFSVKGCAFEGEFIPADQIDRLATLPTLEEAIARLMMTMKEAAAGKLVRTLAAVADQKGSESAA